MRHESRMPSKSKTGFSPGAAQYLISLPALPLFDSSMPLIDAVWLAQAVVPLLKAYVPPLKYTVSPAETTVCALAMLANGSASLPASLSLPVGDT